MVVACSACNHRFEGGGYRDETCPACGALALATRSCPRCTSPLGATRVDELVFDGCARCGGVFIDHVTIQRAVAERPDEIVASLPQASEPSAGIHVAATCPTCATAMDKRMASGGSGVIIDVCKSHGVFLDAGELEKLMAFARREATRAASEGHLRYTGDAAPVDKEAAMVGLGVAAGIASLFLGPFGGLVAKLVVGAIGTAVSPDEPVEPGERKR